MVKQWVTSGIVSAMKQAGWGGKRHGGRERDDRRQGAARTVPVRRGGGLSRLRRHQLADRPPLRRMRLVRGRPAADGRRSGRRRRRAASQGPEGKLPPRPHWIKHCAKRWVP